MSPDAERSRAVYERYMFPESAERARALKERDQERHWLKVYYRLGGRNDRALRLITGGRRNDVDV